MTEKFNFHNRRSLSHWGAFTAQVENGVLTGVAPFEHDPAPNDLINSWPEMLYAANRVARPTVRKGWLKSAEEGFSHRHGIRGEDSFVTVSWTEVLDLLANDLKRVRKNYGNPSIFGGSYGWSSAGRLHHARTLVHRFMNAIGGCTGQTTNYSYGAAMTLLPHILGDANAVTGPVTDWTAIHRHCERFVSFGGVAEKNWRVQSGGCGMHLFEKWMALAAKSKIAFTNVSPLRGDIHGSLGADWVCVRPGTDTALILALAYVVHTSGATDQNFLKRCCVGVEHFLAYVMGSIDGRPKTPAWAAAITGIPTCDIEKLAHSLIGRRLMLTAAWSLQRAEYGEQPYWALIALSALLGQIGLPGAGVAFGYGSINGMGNPKYELPIEGLPVPRRPGDIKIPVARIADMLLHPGSTVSYDGAAITYPDIKLVYWGGGNPFHHHQDLFRLKEAFQRPQTIVVHEPWWTATAKHADIILPATTPLERNDIGGSSRDPYLLAMQKAVEPVGDALDDYQIFSQIADRLGVGELFHENRSEQGWLRWLYDRFVDQMAARGFNPPDFEAFWETGYVRIPDPVDDYTLFSRFRQDPKRWPLKTPSGKIELHSRAIASFGYEDCPGHPVWREPSEWLGAALAHRFPLHLISNQPAEKLHSQMDASSASRTAKRAGRSVLFMNTWDAKTRDLKDGSIVRVFNDRGACLASVQFTDDIMRGVVCLPTGATFDPVVGVQERLDTHGNPNALTKDMGTSRLGQGCSAQTCLVEVEQFNRQLPEIFAFYPPPIEP